MYFFYNVILVMSIKFIGIVIDCVLKYYFLVNVKDSMIYLKVKKICVVIYGNLVIKLSMFI